MLTLLRILSYGATAFAFVFVVLSLASGLLWVSEVIEEHSKTAKTVGKRAVHAVIGIHILLYLLDSNLPLSNTLFSIACHVIYLLNFRRFPIISLTSWHFVVSCLLVIVNHFMWFFHFQEISEAAKQRERRWRHPMEPVPPMPTFLDVATFFGVCVWLVPLFLFLSLTANENALPTTIHQQDSSTFVNKSSDDLNPSVGKSQRSSLFVSLWSKALSLSPARGIPRGRSRTNSDGLIAPHVRSRSSSPLLPARPDLSHSLLRSSSPGVGVPSSILMPTSSPLHSPGESSTSITYDTGSWIPVDRDSRPSSQPNSPGAQSSLRGFENFGNRRRVHLQAPPPRRTLSDTK